MNGYAVVLTVKLGGVSGDGKRYLDFIYMTIFSFFITLSISFIVNFVFFSKALLYLSTKSSFYYSKFDN